MGQESKIEWTDHTFSPWHGCVKVSQGCKNCYADAQNRRFGESHWGPSAPRKMLSEGYWSQPLTWDRTAEAQGVRRRVFCASMADVFEDLPDDHPSAVAVKSARLRLWAVIEATPSLDWLLLTKRPANVLNMVPHRWVGAHAENWPRVGWPANVWVGTSAEDQATAEERLPHLLRVPAAVRFVSYEPALGPVDWRAAGAFGEWVPPGVRSFAGRYSGPCVSWIIVGGESGPGARLFDLQWARDAVAQCGAAGVPVFVKQMGAVPVMEETLWRALNPSPLLRAANHSKAPAGRVPLLFHDRKGGDMAEWPEDLRVREFPEVAP